MNYNSEDERLLDRFGQWMREARAAAEAADGDGPPPETPAIDQRDGLYRIVEEITAHRHEVKLQTKSSRSLEEQTQSLQRALEQAIDALRSIEPKERQAAWSEGKALALALAELDEALDRGRVQTEKAVARLAAEPRDDVVGRLAEFHQRRPWPERLVCERYYRDLREWLARERPLRERQALLEALLDGYRLIQKRLAQTMLAEGLARIDALGKPVDPEQMNVVEVVDSLDRPAGTVHEEIRRGYTWKGRLLRCAEVRATRSSAQEQPPLTHGLGM